MALPAPRGPGGVGALMSCLVAICCGAYVENSQADEPLRVRRNFMGMHNLKDGGPDILTGFHWTKNLTGDTGYVFDWVFDYDPNSPLNWVGEAIKMNLVPCVRVQDCNGGCTPNPGYAGGVAAQILNWKLANPQYADRYVYLQLWNEPGDPRDYVPMDVFADYLVAAHSAVHQAEDAAALQNPDVAGTLKTMTPGQNNPDSWEAGFSHNPAAAFAFDVWGTHPYPESYPPWYNMHEGHGFVTKHKMIDGYLRDLDKCAEYGRRGFPVMITETAYGDHLGISYEGYPKTTRAMAAAYNVEAFGTWWYQWPEIVAVHPYILSNLSWEAFAWANGGSVDTNGDGIYEPTAPYPQYTDVRNWRIATVNAGLLAPARLSPYRGPTGTIRGTVTRAGTGDPVKHANVHTDGYEFGGPTLFDGQYVVREVPIGTYTLTVAKRGYVTAARQITVLQNQETVTDFSLIYEGKVPKGIYFVDCGAPGIPCMGSCSGCSLFAAYHGQTFTTPSDMGFIKFAAAKPNVGGLTLRFTIIEGDNPWGPVIGSWTSYYLEPTLGGEMIGGEAPGDGIPVQPNTTYFLKIERTDGQGVYLYTSDSNPYSGGHRWVGDTTQPGWDIYGTIRGNTVEVYTPTGTLTGSVTDAAAQPIAGANVTMAPGGHGGTTNGAGIYTIHDIPVGIYGVTASASGFTPDTRTGVSIGDGQTTTVNFSLAEGPDAGSITGTVKDTSNNPLVGAVVQTTTGGYAAVSGAGGVYTLTDMLPATYTVRASMPGFQTGQVSGVNVAAGQATTLNFSLAPQAPFSGICGGSFENGAFDDPNPDHRTGNCWHQFTTSGFSKSGVTWLGSTAHSPNHVQDFWESTFTSGIYQEASNATIGYLYAGSCWVRGDGISFSIGIDPNGGTSPTSGDIYWSTPVTGTAGWTQISTQVNATGPAVTLFLKAAKGGGGANAQFDDAMLTETPVHQPEPTISRSPSSLSPVTDAGSNPANDTLLVSNSGYGTLNYVITEGVAWMSVSPSAGSSTGEADTISVIYSAASLAPGTYNATITITDAAATNSPQGVDVTLTVNEAGPEPVKADFDKDGDVDMDDHGHIQRCLTGSGVVQDDPDCINARLDGDLDVDADDVFIWMGCMTGANVQAEAGCMP